LGRWNDDAKDDNLDAAGNPQPLDAEFSAAFGNSWLLPGEQLPTQEELDKAKAHHDEHVKSFDKEHWEHLKKMCKENVHHAEMEHCMKGLGRPHHLIEDCVLDLSHIIEEDKQHAYLQALVSHFHHHCPHHHLGFKHHPRPKHIHDHKPIVRDDHHQCPKHHHRKPPQEHEREIIIEEDITIIEDQPEVPHHKPHHHKKRPEGHKGHYHHHRPHHRGGDHHHRPEGEHRPEHRGEGPEGHHHRRHPFLPHHKFGPSKPEHHDKCFKAKEHFKHEGVKLMECLKFEKWYEEEDN